MALMAAESDQAKPQAVCPVCFGARKVFHFGVPPGERVTRQFWVACPRCNPPARAVHGP